MTQNTELDLDFFIWAVAITNAAHHAKHNEDEAVEKVKDILKDKPQLSAAENTEENRKAREGLEKNIKGIMGAVLLHAVQYNSPKIAEIALKNGADPNIPGYVKSGPPNTLYKDEMIKLYFSNQGGPIAIALEHDRAEVINVLLTSPQLQTSSKQRTQVKALAKRLPPEKRDLAESLRKNVNARESFLKGAILSMLKLR